MESRERPNELVGRHMREAKTQGRKDMPEDWLDWLGLGREDAMFVKVLRGQRFPLLHSLNLMLVW